MGQTGSIEANGQGEVEQCLRGLGLTTDRSGWWMLGNVRAMVHPVGVAVYVFEPDGRSWQARLEGAPEPVLRAVLAQAGITG